MSADRCLPRTRSTPLQPSSPRALLQRQGLWKHIPSIAGITTEYFGTGPALDVVKQHLPADVPVPGNRDDDDYFANPPEITQ